jgi:hypothetical protein
MLKGIVTIRYTDGSFYEGPYIGEEWLDAAGRVVEKGRAHNHYGIFQCSDGRTFEGKMIDNHFDPNNLQVRILLYCSSPPALLLTYLLTYLLPVCIL